MKITIFYSVVSCSLPDRYQCFGRTCCPILEVEELSSVLKVEAAGSADMLLLISKTTVHYIPEAHNCNTIMITSNLIQVQKCSQVHII